MFQQLNKFFPALTVVFLVISMNGCDKLMSEKMSLDGTWQFKYDPQNQGISEGWFQSDLNRNDWQAETVPGEWDDAGYDGLAWYATTFKYGKLAAGYNLALVFESVDDNAIVWLNGQQIAEHHGWGQLFFVDISEIYRSDSLNHLVARIEDLGGPGGINKNVYLKPYTSLADLYATPVSRKVAPPSPDWAKNALVYEVFVRSHSQAGTFEALKADLPRIKDLGVDILWLMPIHPVGQARSKGSYGSPYAVADYYGVNPRMGTLAEFKSLVASAHELGMQLILDFVLNHSAWDNTLISQHPEWYTHNEAGEIVSPNSDWYDVADFDYDQAGLRDYMIDMLTWWLTETDVDGFRFDVAELVPNNFWAAAKSACQRVKSDVFFLAEGAVPELHLNGHDMTYSWNVWDYLTQVAQGKAKVSQLRQSIEMEAYQYPRGALRMRFTENHDKPRSRTYIGDADLNLTAWAFVALMPGNPLIYAGQEIGETIQPTLFEKDVVNWSLGDAGLSERMAELIRLRKKYIQPHSAFEIFLADDAKQVIAYKHGEMVAFFNFSHEPFRFSAKGMQTILAGGLSETADGLILQPKQFGVIQ